MPLKTIFPWQVQQWQSLWRERQQMRLPHAFLFSGISGVGKKQFALALADALLCVNIKTDGSACGDCRGCYLRQAESHPDLHIVEPEESQHTIKVDQIRETVDFVNTTAQQGGQRIVIINPAHAMNINAANALLKTLEEPAPHALFILISAESTRLPATIQSRCQKIVFKKPEHTIALSWLHEHAAANIQHADIELALRMSYGAPLKALTSLENNFLKERNDLYQSFYALSQHQTDPLQAALQWQESNPVTFLNLLRMWLRDLLRCKLTQGAAELINVDYRDVYLKLTQKISVKNLMRYIDCVENTYANSANSINLNRQLLLEELFIQWVNYVSG